jgi:Holliday junction resolvase
MSNKAKGSKCERELYDLFVTNNFRCVRVAGSGVMENTACDLIAGKKNDRKYCIEVKSTKVPYKYITKEQINDFIVFSEIFGLVPVVAVRFNREGWFFFSPSQLKDAGKNWSISLEEAKIEGKRFSQFFNDFNSSNKIYDNDLEQ